MNLHFTSSNSNKDFDLINLLAVLEYFKENDNIEFKIYDYQYNDVNFHWKNIKPSIIDFLENKNSESIKVNFEDFKMFAKFIGQTENGSFDILFDSKSSNINVEIYDSYFWNISSNDEKFISDLFSLLETLDLNAQIEQDISDL